MIEVHPSQSLVRWSQSLTPERFDRLMQELVIGKVGVGLSKLLPWHTRTRGNSEVVETANVAARLPMSESWLCLPTQEYVDEKAKVFYFCLCVLLTFQRRLLPKPRDRLPLPNDDY